MSHTTVIDPDSRPRRSRWWPPGLAAVDPHGKRHERVRVDEPLAGPPPSFLRRLCGLLLRLGCELSLSHCHPFLDPATQPTRPYPAAEPAALDAADQEEVADRLGRRRELRVVNAHGASRQLHGQPAAAGPKLHPPIRRPADRFDRTADHLAGTPLNQHLAVVDHQLGQGRQRTGQRLTDGIGILRRHLTAHLPAAVTAVELDIAQLVRDRIPAQHDDLTHRYPLPLPVPAATRSREAGTRRTSSEPRTA